MEGKCQKFVHHWREKTEKEIAMDLVGSRVGCHLSWLWRQNNLARIGVLETLNSVTFLHWRAGSKSGIQIQSNFLDTYTKLEKHLRFCVWFLECWNRQWSLSSM